MKQIDLWKGKLKAAYAERTIVVKQYNAAERALCRLSLIIEDLENKLERHMAKSKSKVK